MLRRLSGLAISSCRAFSTGNACSIRCAIDGQLAICGVDLHSRREAADQQQPVIVAPVEGLPRA